MTGFKLCFPSSWLRGIWDQRDQEAIARFVDPSLGVWVIYSFGVSRVPYHFLSLEEPLGQGEHGFGYLGGAGFGECRPEPGSPPVCGDGGVRVGGCRFGVTEPLFLQGVEDYLRSGAGKPAERARLRREGEELQRAAGDRVYFLSDEWWGAVFYFADRVDGWVLLAIDMEDCSA